MRKASYILKEFIFDIHLIFYTYSGRLRWARENDYFRNSMLFALLPTVIKRKTQFCWEKECFAI
jgi:hypothetical protein